MQASAGGSWFGPTAKMATLAAGRQFTQALPRETPRVLNLPSIIETPSPLCPFVRATWLEDGNPQHPAWLHIAAPGTLRVWRMAMSRLPMTLVVPDASLFARALGTALKTRHAAGSPPPGHVELLNLMARALGHRNLQSLQAGVVLTAPLPEPPLAAEDRPAPAALSDNARKALMQFDSRGRLIRWPVKYSIQTLAMWVLWTLFDGRRSYTEGQVNEILKAANDFGDHVTLRRELINHQLMSRQDDCSDYRKLPARPDAETRALLQAWRLRQRSQPSQRVERDDSPRRRQQALKAAQAGA